MVQATHLVLDHGYVRFIEGYGSDESIVEAARMSTDKGFLGWGPVCIDCDPQSTTDANLMPPGMHCTKCGNGGLMFRGDEKLLRYLWENKHATPFEMGGMIIEVMAPIFVFREWHRHRTQSYNEMSARYIPLPDVNYIPSVERLMINAGGTNRQAGTIKDAEALTKDNALVFQNLLRESYTDAQQTYEWALQVGIPKELARVHLPVGRYSKMRANANLRNWLAFVTLRSDEKAQWEIRQYSNIVLEILTERFPKTIELFKEGFGK